MPDKPEYIDRLLEEHDIGKDTFYKRLVELMDECDRDYDKTELLAIVDQLILTYKLMLRRLEQDRSAVADLYESFYCDMRHLRSENLVLDVATIDLNVIAPDKGAVKAAIKRLASIKGPNLKVAAVVSLNAKADPITSADKMALSTGILTKLKKMKIGAKLAARQLGQLKAKQLDPEVAILEYLLELKPSDLGQRAKQIYEAFRKLNVELRTTPWVESDGSVGLPKLDERPSAKSTSWFTFSGSKEQIYGTWTVDRELPPSVIRYTSKRRYDPHRADKSSVIAQHESVSENKLHRRRSKGNA